MTSLEPGELRAEGKKPQKLHFPCDEWHAISLCAISEHRWKEQGTVRVDDDWLLLVSGEKGVGSLLNTPTPIRGMDAASIPAHYTAAMQSLTGCYNASPGSVTITSLLTHGYYFNRSITGAMRAANGCSCSASSSGTIAFACVPTTSTPHARPLLDS